MFIVQDPKLDFADVLIRPKRSRLASRSEVSLDRDIKMPHAGRSVTGFPLMASNMDSVGTFAMVKAMAEINAYTVLHKHYAPQEVIDFFKAATPTERALTFLSFGTSDESFDERVKPVIDALAPDFMPHLCIDIANGYSEHFVNFISKTREAYPDAVIMAGNICTPEMCEQLVLSGADIVKVGIGPGSVCTTRRVTGVGYPQLSAIIECADAAHGLKGQICGDGGCTVPGDVAKAFGGGADFVMLGGMLAGHDEGGGTIEGGKVKFYGMSSEAAMTKYEGGVAAYRASEGKTVTLPYRGPVAPTLQEIAGGLRSTCTYVGAQSLKELPKRTTFIQVGRQLNEVYANYDE